MTTEMELSGESNQIRNRKIRIDLSEGWELVEEKIIAEVGHYTDVVDAELADGASLIHQEFRGAQLVSKTYVFNGQVRLVPEQKQLPEPKE